MFLKTCQFMFSCHHWTCVSHSLHINFDSPCTSNAEQCITVIPLQNQSKWDHCNLSDLRFDIQLLGKNVQTSEFVAAMEHIMLTSGPILHCVEFMCFSLQWFNHFSGVCTICCYGEDSTLHNISIPELRNYYGESSHLSFWSCSSLLSRIYSCYEAPMYPSRVYHQNSELHVHAWCMIAHL